MEQILNSIIQVDQELFLFLNNLGQPNWDQFWLFVTDKKSWIPFYILLLVYLLAKTKNWKVVLAIGIFIGLLITLVDQSITSFFKPYFHRYRPCHNEELVDHLRKVKDSCGGYYSFFSSHAANSFALAVFFIRTVKLATWMKVLFILWAAIVAYSRIYVGVHFPLDIVVGTLWGSLLAYILSIAYTKWLKARLS